MKQIVITYRTILIMTASVLTLTSHAQTDTAHFYKAPDGTNIYYEVHGKGYPVVLVHGFIVTSVNWKKATVYQDLLDAGYQVILMDLRGNGKSDKPHISAPYENDAQAKDIMGIVSELGIKKYDVLGYSRGSIITARLLVLDKRINKGILGGIGTGFTDPEWPRRIMFYRALMGDSVPELKAMVANVNKSGLDQLALAYQQKEQPSTSKEALGKINRPVMVICGDKDNDNGAGNELAALIPKSQFKEVPGDHNHASGTKEFSNEVLAFFKK